MTRAAPRSETARRAGGPAPAATAVAVAAFLTMLLPAGVPAEPTAAPAITFIHMAGPTTGWARTNTRLLRTDDGGVHWTDVTPPGRASIADAAHAFLGGSAAWIAVAPGAAATVDVFRTTNGGRTWRRAVATAQNVGQMVFADARRGWMTVDLDNAMSSEALRLLHTEDGGVTWTEVARTDLPVDPVRSGLPISGDKSGFAFLDATTGWITGYVPRDNYTYLYTTTNGGRTWRFETLPLPTGMGTVQVGLNPPAVFAPSEAVLTAQLNGARVPLTLVYVTHDAGAHWVFTAPVPANTPVSSFLTARVGWMSSGTTLYATRDAGHHWTIEPPSGVFRDVAELDFVSETAGWAVIRSAPFLLKTSDGGRTWAPVR
ncbi:MAG TPA: hypothetical protein VKZ50_00935 [bacterium]|nr:hypothetical protein [bacterium]